MRRKQSAVLVLLGYTIIVKYLLFVNAVHVKQFQCPGLGFHV